MSDKEQIETTIQTYFDSMYESSGDKVHAAFHPNAMITGYMGDKLLEIIGVRFRKNGWESATITRGERCVPSL